MRLIRYCAPFFAALSFFVGVPASADVIYQFSGVCDRYFNVGIGSTPEFVPCDTLANPTVQLTLTLDDKYPSVGFTACVGPPFTCLLNKLVWTDHAYASGAELSIEISASIGRSCGPIVSGVPPNVSIFAERIECGFDMDAGTGAFFFETIDTFTPGVDHFVEGTGVWTQIAGPIDEPTTLALAGLALLPLAFVGRRNS